jgi:hypothetical protein
VIDKIEMASTAPAPPFAVIMGTARDCEDQLRASLASLTEVARRFSPSVDDVCFIFFENDSVDSTKQVLSEFCGEFPERRFLLSEPGLQAVSPKRTHRLAYARNALLAFLVSKGWLRSLEVLIVADLDSVNNSIFMDGFDDALRLTTCNSEIPGALDVATANQRGRYYDRWALRTEHSGNLWARQISCFKPEFVAQGVRFFFPNVEGVSAESIAPSCGVLPVISAFGGLALYRASKLRDRVNPNELAPGVAYDGVDTTMIKGIGFPWMEGQDCEHVRFHESLHKASVDAGEGDLRVGIVSNMLNTGPTDDVVNSPEAREGSHFLTLERDGTYSAGIKGVVKYTRVTSSSEANQRATDVAYDESAPTTATS